MFVKIGQNLLFENLSRLDLESKAVVHPMDGVLQVGRRADLEQNEHKQGHIGFIFLLVAKIVSVFLASLRI